MGDKLTVDDLAAMVRGANGMLAVLAAVFPGLPADELLEHARAVETCPTAQELLHQVIVLRKLKVS